jgi:hypothetical protein
MKPIQMECKGSIVTIVYPERVKELEARGWTVVGAKKVVEAKPKPIVNKPSDEEK